MSDAGRPPGPLAVLSAAKRASWFGTRPGWYGVSAVDGRYHWVDLPLQVAASVEPELSPDGTKVGYAFTGRTPGRQFSPVVGFAVYDTQTGHVSTWRVPTRHGLAVGLTEGGWSPDSRWFVADFGQTVTRDGGNDYRLLAFPVNGGAAVAQDHADYCCISPLGRSGAQELAWFGGDASKRVYLDRPGQGKAVSFGIDRSGEAGPWFSPDGRRFVFIAEGPAGPHATTFRLFVGDRVYPGGRTTTDQFSPRLQPFRVLGWINNRNVAVDAHVSGGGVLLLHRGHSQRRVPPAPECRTTVFLARDSTGRCRPAGQPAGPRGAAPSGAGPPSSRRRCGRGAAARWLRALVLEALCRRLSRSRSTSQGGTPR